jgi:formylglycine-generating enzyme required for sulfatase activity
LRRAVAIAVVLGAAGTAVAIATTRRRTDEIARCGPGFVPRGWRCEARPDGPDPVGAGTGACPPPLAPSPHGCDAPDARVLVPESAISVGPSDWEAEGRIAPRTIRVRAFRIDAFEVTRGRWRGNAGNAAGRRETDEAASTDAARAASAMTRGEAAAFCEARGGRLPTEDEWMVAAASSVNPPRRYPWGDTGAVCRRAAWGLLAGPCAHGADGPDTVGAHPDGDSPLGVHDLAGNVAEWVSVDTGPAGAGYGYGFAKGGSWATSLASDLRIWARLTLDPEARDPRVGVRCAYPP